MFLLAIQGRLNDSVRSKTDPFLHLWKTERRELNGRCKTYKKEFEMSFFFFLRGIKFTIFNLLFTSSFFIRTKSVQLVYFQNA